MSATETDSMASHVAFLSNSFQLVPPAAIPAMLDCILASTGVSPMSLFSALLDAFPNVAKESEVVHAVHSLNVTWRWRDGRIDPIYLKVKAKI